MTDQIQSILKDLYAIDGSLSKHEEKLKAIIKEILASKPQVPLDENFKTELKLLILARVRELQNKPVKQKDLINNNFNFMKRFYYLLTGATLAVLVIAPAIYLYNNQITLKPAHQAGENLFAYKVTPLGNNAFGELQSSQNGSVTADQAIGLGGGAPAAAPLATESKMPATRSSIGIVPGEWTTYRYVYKGEPIKIDQDSLDVYRRTKGAGTSIPVNQAISNLNFGLADLGSFAGARLQNFSIIQDQDFGYMVDVNLSEGMININQNWEQWHYPQCYDEKCNETNRLKESDMLTDEQMITLADAFLKDHGVSLENYSQPYVMDSWRQAFELAQSQDYYFPEWASVVYPFTMNGQEVLDESGNKQGINVGIDFRNKRVSSVNNIITQRYESSAYATEKNIDKIMKLVEKGGLYGYVDPNATKTVDIELGEPKLGYVKMWNYNLGKSEELIVPAYIFPLTKQPEGLQFFGRQAVVIPIIADLIKQSANGGGPVRIMEKTAQ